MTLQPAPSGREERGGGEGRWRGEEEREGGEGRGRGEEEREEWKKEGREVRRG